MIYQQLVGLRRRQQEGRTLSQGGTRSSGVVGTAQLSQPNVPDASPYPEGPVELMNLVTALFLDGLKKVGQAGCVQFRVVSWASGTPSLALFPLGQRSIWRRTTRCRAPPHSRRRSRQQYECIRSFGTYDNEFTTPETSAKSSSPESITDTVENVQSARSVTTRFGCKGERNRSFVLSPMITLTASVCCCTVLSHGDSSLAEDSTKETVPTVAEIMQRTLRFLFGDPAGVKATGPQKKLLSA